MICYETMYFVICYLQLTICCIFACYERCSRHLALHITLCTLLYILLCTSFWITSFILCRLILGIICIYIYTHHVVLYCYIMLVGLYDVLLCHCVISFHSIPNPVVSSYVMLCFVFRLCYVLYPLIPKYVKSYIEVFLSVHFSIHCSKFFLCCGCTIKHAWARLGLLKQSEVHVGHCKASALDQGSNAPKPKAPPPSSKPLTPNP